MKQIGLVLSFLLLETVYCYINGGMLGPQCRNMEIQHSFGTEYSSKPFIIEPSRVSLLKGNQVEVVLTSTVPIYGFMMDGRIDGRFGGFFVRVDQPDYNFLLNCEGYPNTTMTHKDNRDKIYISGLWEATENGDIIFDAAVVGEKYWKRTVLPTTAPATTRLSTTNNPTTQSASTPTPSTPTATTSNPTTQSASTSTPSASTATASNSTTQSSSVSTPTLLAGPVLAISIGVSALGLYVRRRLPSTPAPKQKVRPSNYCDSLPSERQQATPRPNTHQHHHQLQQFQTHSVNTLQHNTKTSQVIPWHQQQHLQQQQQTPQFNPQYQQQWTSHIKGLALTKGADNYGGNLMRNTSTSPPDPSPDQSNEYITGGGKSCLEQMISRRDIMRVLKNLAALQIFTVAVAFDYETFESEFKRLEYMMIGFTVWALVFCLICVLLTHIELYFYKSVSPHSAYPIQNKFGINLVLESCHTLVNVCFTLLLIVGFHLVHFRVCCRSQNLTSQPSVTATPTDGATSDQKTSCYPQIATATLLISHFLHLEGSLFLLGWRMDLVRHLEYKLLSMLSLCMAVAAFVLFLLCNHITISALVGVAVTLSLTQTITACSLCGPSHELRNIMMWGLRALAVLQAAFTVASVFVFQIFEFRNCKFLQYVLIGFFVWTLVFCGICVVLKNIAWTYHRSRKRASPPWCFSWIVNRVSLVPIICHALISLAAVILLFVL